MDIYKITENDDGTCTLDCGFTDAEISMLLNYAVNHILKESVEKMASSEDADEEIS